MPLLETTFANLWNRIARLGRRRLTGGLDLGFLVIDKRVSKRHFYIPQIKRAEHMVVLGKTGSGKTRLLLRMCLQDIRAGRGFVFFDHHGETVPQLLSAIAAEEKRSGQDLSSRLVVIDPSDSQWSVGLNVLQPTGRNPFVEVVSIAGILKDRWGLTTFGAPTEELLRNSLYVLAESGLTLTELAPLLTDSSFRASCLKKVKNQDVRDYWELRFEPQSAAMKAVRRDPVLNKVSEFVSDPHFKHILGQRQSTIDLVDCLNRGAWILVDLSKGRLGRHSSTLGSLILGQLKQAIFRRSVRQIFTLYCDEIQNLLVADSGIDTLLAEARKFGVSVVSANQFLDQFPKEMRSAIQATGSQIYFQLSPEDAQQAAAMLDGGKPVAELLKNLPKRHCIAKSGQYRWQQVEVPQFDLPASPFGDLLQRSRTHSARLRCEVEQDILSRRPKRITSIKEEALREWE
jgi:hypothetical protein